MAEKKHLMLNMRIRPALRERLDAAISALHPYPPSISVVMERGLILALEELECQAASRVRQKQEGDHG